MKGSKSIDGSRFASFTMLSYNDDHGKTENKFKYKGFSFKYIFILAYTN